MRELLIQSDGLSWIRYMHVVEIIVHPLHPSWLWAWPPGTFPITYYNVVLTVTHFPASSTVDTNPVFIENE